jgi:hypothetical protein
LRDWSSDVCSSDLFTARRRFALAGLFIEPIGKISREFESRACRDLRNGRNLIGPVYFIGQ